jgi:hypothetical protein
MKLGQVASDALGVSGRAMWRALAAGETDTTIMADLARKTLKRKKPAVVRARWPSGGHAAVGVGGVAGAL